MTNLSRNLDLARIYTRHLEIAELYRVGTPVNEIAAAFHVTRTTVNYVARHYGIDRRQPKTDRKTQQRVLRLYRGKKTRKEIAALIGIDESTVKRIVQRAGAPQRGPRGKRT